MTKQKFLHLASHGEQNPSFFEGAAQAPVLQCDSNVCDTVPLTRSHFLITIATKRYNTLFLGHRQVCCLKIKVTLRNAIKYSKAVTLWLTRPVGTKTIGIAKIFAESIKLLKYLGICIDSIVD